MSWSMYGCQGFRSHGRVLPRKKPECRWPFAQSSVKFVQIKAVLEYLNLINEQSS